MVARKSLAKKYALLSVYDKAKLSYLCKNLKKHNYEFLSTGSTGKKIRQLGFECRDISKITKFKELFDGRVKTINPKIYSSLLYVRNKPKHLKEFRSLNFPNIDLVIVNLYPFDKYSKIYKGEKLIEMIDIGGPSLIRAASKNFKFITTIISKDYYSKLVKNLDKNNGVTDLNFRKKMAIKTFRLTYKYDKSIFNWLNKN